ncbi:hypothetical protein Tco_0593210, partial [Tanacetum coccineum]
FVPSGVLTRTCLITPVKQNEKKVVHTVSTARPVSTVRPFSHKTTQTSSAVRPIYPRMDNVIPRASYSPIKRTRAVVNTGKDNGSFMLKKFEYVDLKGISKSVMAWWLRHMTGNKAYLSDYEDYNGGFVAFGSDPKRDKLKFNLFSVSQMYDKKNSVLFTDTECLILSPSFKFLDENQVVLRAPR